MQMNSHLHSSTAVGDFDDEIIVDSLSERQNVSIMNDSSITLMDRYEMLPAMLTIYLAFDFFLNPRQSKESELNVLVLGISGYGI